MSTVGEYFDSTLIRGIDEGIGAPGLVQSMHGTPADGSLELPTGGEGPTGPVGPAAVPFRWEGDIADRAALDALTPRLGPAQAGKAWRVLSTNTLMYWNGRGFDSFAEAFGAHGPDGQPCTVTVNTVATGAVGSELIATLAGTPPNLTLDLTVPRGIKGRKGDDGGPGPLRNAGDYQDGAHTQDMVPLWDTAAAKWVPRPMPSWRGPWSIVEHQAWDGGAGFIADQNPISAYPLTVAQINIPAQDVAWRPHVAGFVAVGVNVTDASTRVDAEVYVGSASGQVVAKGSGFPYNLRLHNRFMPYFATSTMQPSSAVGVIAAGAATTLFVVLQRNLGSGGAGYYRTNSTIIVWAVPVATP